MNLSDSKKKLVLAGVVCGIVAATGMSPGPHIFSPVLFVLLL